VDPETLLLDEPLSNLDANLREEMRFEVRRLHDEYRYTTIYVTHDQSEAMTTADLIAVMNHGRIEQLGTPEEIYDRPRSAFVARFIGSSNVVTGKVVDDRRIAVAGVVLRGSGGSFAPGGSDVALGSMSIRQHDIVLGMGEPPGGEENVLPATITRNVFLGGNRDYVIEAAEGTQLRVQAPAGQNIARGSRVHARLPADLCRILVA
jgi:iron(III) transport system ATP-binding protein